MSAPLHVAAALAYLTGFMFAARWVYGHLRAREIDRLRADYPALYSEPGSAVRRFYDAYRGHAVMMAMLAAMVWPLALLLPVAAAWMRFMESTPVRSQAEIKDECERRGRRISELERELGLPRLGGQR